MEGIKTGDSLVTGPSFPLAKILMQRARQPRTDLSGLAGAVAEERNNLARYIAVEASLDSVVLGNGTVLGPDHWDLIESRRAVNAAEAEISAKLNDSSISDADLNAWLEEVSKRPLTLKPNGLSDHSTVIGGIARAMKHLVQQNGRAKVAGTLFDVTARNAAAKQLISVKE
ncbi:MAG: hypothetical protein JNL98_39745 [Bryobacterales bacterium]|nr:hypothetical protein [Bryobacterales bacterium]